MVVSRKKGNSGGSAKAVGSFVPRVARKIFENYGFPSADLPSQWPEIVGAELARFSAPERIVWPRQTREATEGMDPETPSRKPPSHRINRARGAVLILRVEGPRAIEIQHCSGQILDSVNALFGYRAITELRIQQGPVARRGDSAPAPAIRQQGERSAPDESGLERISNAGLRAALARLRHNLARRAKRR